MPWSPDDQKRSSSLVQRFAKRIEEERKEERRRLQPYLDELALRLMDGRTKPVDAITLEPVLIEQPKPSRQQRLLATASKFKGAKSRAAIMAVIDEQIAETAHREELASHRARLLALRVDLELERNRRAVPRNWDALAVDLWLQAAYETLYRIPIKIWPKAYGSCMPVASDHRETEFADEVAQAGKEAEIQPLFGIARLRALGMPEKFEVERMEDALSWPTQFLKEHPDIARIVGHAAMWRALDITFTAAEFTKLCERKFDIDPAGFDRTRGVGLLTIAGGLNANVARRAPRRVG